MRKNITLMIVLAGCALLVLGCSNSASNPAGTRPASTQVQGQPATNPPNNSSTGAKVDACKLLSQTDAETILGEPAAAPESPISGQANFVVTSCEYKAKSSPANHVTLIVIQADDALSAKDSFELAQKQAVTQLNVTPQNVSGLGDAAFWQGGIYNNLLVLKGNFQITFTISGETTPEGKVKTLAQQVLAKMP
ncbi:MAG: hypothetical protein WCF84_03820 [Anaerolineae bacterium]